MGRIFPPLSHRIFPSYWKPPIVETQYITDSVSVKKDLIRSATETQAITDSVRKDLVKPNFVVETQAIMDEVKRYLLKPPIVETQTITDGGKYAMSGKLRCIQDTWVNSADPSKNHGSETTMEYDNRTDVGEGYCDVYLQFSALPSGATVTKAILWFYVDYGSSAYAIRAITSSWNESTVAWYGRPSYGSTILYSGNLGVGWNSIDIIAHIWDFNNYGLVFRSADISSSYGPVYIRSREYTGSEPYIEIAYEKTI